MSGPEALDSPAGAEGGPSPDVSVSGPGTGVVNAAAAGCGVGDSAAGSLVSSVVAMAPLPQALCKYSLRVELQERRRMLSVIGDGKTENFRFFRVSLLPLPGRLSFLLIKLAEAEPPETWHRGKEKQGEAVVSVVEALGRAELGHRACCDLVVVVKEVEYSNRAWGLPPRPPAGESHAAVASAVSRREAALQVAMQVAMCKPKSANNQELFI